MTTRLLSIGLRNLAAIGVGDTAQPIRVASLHGFGRAPEGGPNAPRTVQDRDDNPAT